jgi:hypothetical protein
MLFTCLGSPTTPVFDVTGAGALQQRRPPPAVLRRPVGQLDDELIVRTAERQARVRRRARPAEMALRNGGEHSDNVTRHRARMGNARTPSVHRAACPPTPSGRRVRLDHPGRRARQRIDDLDEDAIERSIAEINEAIRRSAARKT